jgi:hypothetical protein
VRLGVHGDVGAGHLWCEEVKLVSDFWRCDNSATGISSTMLAYM